VPRLQTSALIQTEAWRSKSLRVRSLFAYFVRFRHPQDRNISVCLEIFRSSRNVNKVCSLVLAIRALISVRLRPRHSHIQPPHAEALRIRSIGASDLRRLLIVQPYAHA
jgi:hypothetical protein